MAGTGELHRGRYMRHRTYTSGCRAHHLPMDAANPRFETRTLREAALLLGGERKLAEFLDMALWLVSRWLEGLGQPPDSVFKRCVELIESSKGAAAAADELDKGIVVRQVL